MMATLKPCFGSFVIVSQAEPRPMSSIELTKPSRSISIMLAPLKTRTEPAKQMAFCRN